jgi:hypothetical protein
LPLFGRRKLPCSLKNVRQITAQSCSPLGMTSVQYTARV